MSETANDNVHKLPIDGESEALATAREVYRMIDQLSGRTNELVLATAVEAGRRSAQAKEGFAAAAAKLNHMAGQAARATEVVASQVEEFEASAQRRR